MQYARISTIAATLSIVSADGVPSQAKLSPNGT
jgi:hypothetical protein